MIATSLLDPATVQPLAAELMARDRWSRPELLERQRREVSETLRHAVAASSYYREILGAAVAEDAELRDLPVLSKRVLMEHWDRIATDHRLRLRDVEDHLGRDRSGDLLFGQYRACATGGTTGERAVVVYDRAAWISIVANVLRWVRVVGAAPDSRILGIGAPTPLHVTNRAFAELRAGRADAPGLSVLTPLPQVVGALNAYQPDIVITYPSFARTLAEEQGGGRLRIRPRTVVSTAEVLEPEARHLIGRTWGAVALDAYGTTEGGLLGTECAAAAGIHLAEDMVVLEVVDAANQPVAASRPGSKVLLTTLFNRALPLIRYEISDIVTMAEGPCPCGRPYARVALIDGRREDYVRLRNASGGYVQVHAGRLNRPLCGVAGLRQYQFAVVDETLRLRISVREDASPEEVSALAACAMRRALELAGAVTTVSVDVVDEIERTGAGAKLRPVGQAG